MDGESGLSELQLLILRSLSKVSRVEDLAKVVKIPPFDLGKEIARLQIDGYIEADGTITPKGTNAIRDSDVRRP
jgi:hypothetical protein